MKHLIVLIGKDEIKVLRYAEKLGAIHNCPYIADDNHPYFARDFVRDIIKNFSKYIIFTNSPYVLGEINNILYSQDVAKRFPHNAESIKKIIPEDLWIEKCEAFEIVNGEPVDIFDYELNLINDGALDNETSSRINNEFDEISDFEEYDGE